jgi:acetolactate synthase-1/2/3 large subunit
MNIRRVMTHGEKAAAYMADGYARASGKPGVCFAQNIGASNLAAGLRDAAQAGVPVIAFTGGPNAVSRHRNYYQEVEDFSQFDPVTKFNGTVDHVSRLPDLMRQAFREATTGAPGPVHLRLPGVIADVIDHEADLDLVVDERYARAPAFRPAPDPTQVEAALDRIADAARPIVVAGGGVMTSRAQAQLVAFAEKLSLPVATSLNAKSAIPDDHPLAVGVIGTYSRECANRAVYEADLVVFVGSHTGGQVTSLWKVPTPDIPIVHLDIDPAEFGRNYPHTTPVLADARRGLEALIAAADTVPESARADWLARVRGLVADWRAAEAPNLRSDAVPMRPERVCQAISDGLPADGVLVADTGHSGIWTGTMVQLTQPGQRYIRCAGSLGWALPGSIGVKAALPDRPVVCFAGDGAAYYHIAELETAARYGINTVFVINNNSALNQEIAHYDWAYGGKQRGKSEEMWRFGRVSFAEVAQAFGCAGYRVEDPADLGDALRDALACGRPAVIDAVTDTYAIPKAPWTP